MRVQRSRLSFVGLGAVLWVLAAAAGAWGAAAEAGKAWLLSTVEADGAWRSERDPAGLRSTAASLSALGADAPPASDFWLFAQRPGNLEESTACALALSVATPPEFLVPVETQRTAPGKWGASVGSRPDPYHTALALLSLSYTETGTFEERATGIEYLISAQNADGSWAAGEDGQETAVTTAVVVQALLAAGKVVTSAEVVDARRWLELHQDMDGGWGVLGSTPATTETHKVSGPIRCQTYILHEKGKAGWA